MIIESPPILPDLLRPHLAAVFCGTAPGFVSAAHGAYYAHPQNKFWRTLFATGLTPRLLLPSEFKELYKWGLGLTDIAKHDCGMDKDLKPQSLGLAATADLKARIERFAPKILAFTSLTGGRHYLKQKVIFGPQPDMIGQTNIWVLPSPSPTAQWNWNEDIWHDLASAIRTLSDQ